MNFGTITVKVPADIPYRNLPKRITQGLLNMHIKVATSKRMLLATIMFHLP
jgi:hypothetical protein